MVTSDVAQLQVQTIPYKFKWYKSIQRYGFHKVWLKYCLIWPVLGHVQAHMGQWANYYDSAQLQV